MTDTVDAATFAPLEGTDPALPGDPFARPRYSYGQLLGADDFVSEQRYHLLRARLRNALLHGSGVACGLDVIAKTVADPPAVELICTPGLAIDPLGREIFVPESICLDVTGLANNESFWSDLSPPPDDPEGDTRRCYAVLSYRACLSAQTPAIAQPCSDADNSLVYSRVLDSYRLCLEATPPPDPHALSRDWPALKAPLGLRARLQALLTDTPPHPEQLWSYPQDAKVLLAVVDLKPVGSPAETTDIGAVDTSVRALLPDVQTVASLATGLRLIGPAAGSAFALDTVLVAAGTGGDAGKAIVTATLTDDIQAGTVTADSVHLFKLNGGAWTAPATAAPTVAGAVITLKVNEDWSGGATYQLVLSGGGARPILDTHNRPLAGLTDEPAPPAGRGRDAVVIGVFTP
ncbi:hypothetical protein AS593_07315 [Caulobacter vibrioides]|nr:hypothetical protein AS593_07315 [Caulobacter vibrioides]